MRRSLLDTDILSEIMRARNKSVMERAQTYRNEHSRFIVSVMTITEVVKGLARVRREEALHRFIDELDQLEILTFTTEQAVIAGRIYAELERAGQPIGRADLMIAAAAIENDLELVTGNLDHYERLGLLGFRLSLSNWRT